jgi:hypothetical protein
MLNVIDREAFAAENAEVKRQIENLPKRTAVPADVQQLVRELMDAGIPMAAAHILARRMAGVPHELGLHVQRLEGRIIELENELKSLRFLMRLGQVRPPDIRTQLQGASCWQHPRC